MEVELILMGPYSLGLTARCEYQKIIAKLGDAEVEVQVGEETCKLTSESGATITISHGEFPKEAWSGLGKVVMKVCGTEAQIEAVLALRDLRENYSVETAVEHIFTVVRELDITPQPTQRAYLRGFFRELSQVPNQPRQSLAAEQEPELAALDRFLSRRDGYAKWGLLKGMIKFVDSAHRSPDVLMDQEGAAAAASEGEEPNHSAPAGRSGRFASSQRSPGCGLL